MVSSPGLCRKTASGDLRARHLTQRAPPNAELSYINTKRTNIIPPTLACGVHPRRQYAEAFATSHAWTLSGLDGTMELLHLCD